jgi:transcriptional regulator with XRE-family HTH domain
MGDKQNISKVEQYVIDYTIKLRLDSGYNQEYIANILGVHRSFVTNVENPNNRAKYNLKHINALADHFGLSPKEFLPEKALKI